MKTPDWSRVFDQWPAKVLALAAALLLFLVNRFDALQARTFVVPLRVVTDTALVPAQEFDHRVKVTIRGASDLVSAVAEGDLEAVLDLSGHQGEGVFHAPVLVTRKGTAAENTALEVAVDPLALDLHLEQKVVRTVPVRPDFQGQPGKNFELAGFQVTPSVITVEGPRSVVQSLESVSTEAIELRAKTDTFTLKARVEPGSGLVTFPYGNLVEVKGLMTSSLASLVLENVVPVAVNLSPALVLEAPLPTVRVRLRGTTAALAALPKDAAGDPTVSISADLLASSTAGEVSAVELKASLPEGVELVDLSPAVVPVFLAVKP